MKIIHCADLHLDSQMTSNLSKEQAEERKAELLNTYNRMLKYAKENSISAIIIAGDLFDTSNVSMSARNTVYNGILSNPDINFYYLRGNHDEADWLANYSTIPANLKLFGGNWTIYKENEVITIAGIEQNSANSGILYDELNLSADDINIVIMHGQESDVLLKNEQQSNILNQSFADYNANGTINIKNTNNSDYTDLIHLKNLRNKSIDYLALGHVHFYKKERLDSRGVYCYSGCLEGRGFDECGTKGFVVLDIDTQRKSVKSEFVPFASRRLYAVEADITGCCTTTEIAYRIQEKLEFAGCTAESLVKAVLTGHTDIECEKNIRLILKHFQENYYYFKLKDMSGLKIDYNTYLYDESLKGEFVRNVMAAQDMSEEDKSYIIRYGIQALLGEEID